MKYLIISFMVCIISCIDNGVQKQDTFSIKLYNHLKSDLYLENLESQDGVDIFKDTLIVVSYIRRFKALAQDESDRYGIPASIKMAQSILETNAGSSQLAKKNNNHFGVKCFNRICKKGHCSNFGDDSHKDFFRKYDNAWESWRAHSKMIVSGKYKTLLKHGDDYEAWAKGLKKLGYATAKHYDKTLVELIERYHLDDLD